MEQLLQEDELKIRIKKTIKSFWPFIYFISISNSVLNYFIREIYHLPIIKISKVRTNGNAGYRVWKLAGGQGDQDISLPFGPFEDIDFFGLEDTDESTEKPLLIYFC